MLHVNTDAGTKHVLSLGYMDSSQLHAIFAHIFCHVLSQGTKFNHYMGGLSNTSRKSKLCEVRDCLVCRDFLLDLDYLDGQGIGGDWA